MFVLGFGTGLVGYLKVAVVGRIQLGSVARSVISVSRPTNTSALLYLNESRSGPQGAGNNLYSKLLDLDFVVGRFELENSRSTFSARHLVRQGALVFARGMFAARVACRLRPCMGHSFTLRFSFWLFLSHSDGGVAGPLTGRLPQWYLGQHKDRHNSRAMKHLHSLLTRQCMHTY